jgi:hypothetical protein
VTTRYKDLEGCLDQKLPDARIMEDQPILLEDKVGEGCCVCACVCACVCVWVGV